jgi:hypothetical protein
MSCWCSGHDAPFWGKEKAPIASGLFRTPSCLYLVVSTASSSGSTLDGRVAVQLAGRLSAELLMLSTILSWTSDIYVVTLPEFGFLRLSPRWRVVF